MRAVAATRLASGKVAASAGSQEKVLEPLEERESQNQQTVPAHRQGAKRFPTLGLGPHQQKPRRCRRRGLASKEPEQICEEERQSQVRMEPRHSGCFAVRVAPAVGVPGAVAGRVVDSRCSPEHQPLLPQLRPCISREPQEAAKFVCVECGFSANADFVAACNIREAGLALLACSYPSADGSPSRQEPTEGLPA